jgi:uncharacterized protein YbjT (DUF2867 family)
MPNSILIAGATGLVGSSLVDIVKNDSFFIEIIILTRRDIPSLRKYLNITQHIIDFHKPESYRHLVKADTVVCTLGTTIKKAGSQEKFKEVDYTYPLQIAAAASENKCRKYILVSAAGADPSSKVFYNRTKGELERDLKKISFTEVHILRPSLLLGKRNETRTGEAIGQKIIPIISPILPYKYRPIKAATVADKIKRTAKDNTMGIYIYEGKDFYT